MEICTRKLALNKKFSSTFFKRWRVFSGQRLLVDGNFILLHIIRTNSITREGLLWALQKQMRCGFWKRKKISYQMHTYDASDGQIDGAAVARKVGMEPAKVFKTLVTQGHSGNYFVCVLPVEHELNLKKAAKVFGEKSLEMIPVAKINAVTGYIRGGCSPIG